MKRRDQVLVGMVAVLTVWGLGAAQARAAEPAEQASAPAGALVVRVDTVPDEAAGAPAFEFGGDLGSFALGAGESQVFADLRPGRYTVDLLLAGGWISTRISCRGGEVEMSPSGASAAVTLQQGEPAACTFTVEHEGVRPRVDDLTVLPLTGAAVPLPALLGAGTFALLAGLAMVLDGRLRIAAPAGPAAASPQRQPAAPRPGASRRALGETGAESLQAGERR